MLWYLLLFVQRVLSSSKQDASINYYDELDTINELTKPEKLVIGLLAKNKGIRADQIALIMDYSLRQVMRIISSLELKGKIKRVGSKKQATEKLFKSQKLY